jgi:hypothetical protein
MLMDETSISAPLSQTIARSSPVQSTAWAYFAISLAIAGTVVWGFWPSYFGPLLAGAVTRPWFIHVHATVFLGWVALLIVQASFIAFGKVAQHRRVGRMGAFYGALVFGVGLAVSIAAPALRVRSGVLPERFASLVVLYNLVDILCFGGFFAAALVTRRQPELHKRWILSATIALSGAAVGRVIQDQQLYRVVWLSPLVASMLIDLLTRRRLHVVSLVSLCALLVVSFKVAIIAMSPVWAAVGHTILGLFL